VQLVNLADPERLKGDALKAYQDWLAVAGTITPLSDVNYQRPQLIVDALIGTGLDRNLNSQWLEVVELINKSTLPVLAIDIPSGLDANTGHVWGGAVKADLSITFIALKQGMYTAQARDYCGEIIFKSLAVPAELYQQVNSPISLLNWTSLQTQLPPRNASSHKGQHGKVLIIGGNQGMPGAVRIAGEAALRSGAGLVKIITHSDHAAMLIATRPELMVQGISNPDSEKDQIKESLDWADSIAIGPGLGSNSWALALLELSLQQTQSKVLDADALNLLSQFASTDLTKAILTPHPGEAARLLEIGIQEVENDRYQALRQLLQKYHSTIVLKGAGSLIGSTVDSSAENNSDYPISVCPYGNAGMSSAGMGDCLSGIVASLLNQTPTAKLTAEIAVSIHAKAGDMAAKDGMIGLLASDLMPHIRTLRNA